MANSEPWLLMSLSNSSLCPSQAYGHAMLDDNGLPYILTIWKA